MAYKAVVASSLMLGAAQGHIFSSWSTQTATTANKIVEIPASGGTRPVAAFGIATGTYPAATTVDLKADATLSGGMFIKGFAFPKAKHDEFVAACTKPEDALVSVYEWGYGPCDDFMTALKAQANPAATTFSATTTPKEGGGSMVKATFPLLGASEGLYVMFENLMGQPVTFANAEFSIQNVAAPVKAEEDLVFPAATVHMSAAVVKLADETPTEKTIVSFKAKGTAVAGAKPTAMMVVNKEQMAPERLGCTFGFYFGWFKKNTAGQNVCKQADFTYTMDGDILKLTGVIKAVTPEQLAGDIQVDPSFTLFQGDADYKFDAEAHGADSMYVVIPNRLDTPITLEGLHVSYEAADMLSNLMKDPKAILKGGPVAGVVIAVLVGVFALMAAAYCAGKRKAAAAAKAAEAKAEGKQQGNALV